MHAKPWPVWVLLLTSCNLNGLGVANETECASKYAVPAPTNRGVNSAYYYCRVLFAPNSTPEEIAQANCLLPKMVTAQNDRGLSAAAATCPKSSG